MAEKDEGFVQRWSRLKQQSREGEPQEEPAPALPQPVDAADGAPPEAGDKPEEEKPFDPATLPPVETLNKDSDYAAFMRPEVPEDLRQKALRRLWASDPIFSAPDPADMHNIDYNAVPTFPEGVKTLYRIGKGMFDELEAEAEKAAAHSESTTPGAQVAAEKPAGELPDAHPPDVAAQQGNTTEIKESDKKKA